MKKPLRITQEGAGGVPAYIVTFSDMVTLLLTFFVMLLSLAELQDEEIFHKGQDSFVESIKFFGLGMFRGRNPKADFGNAMVRYFIEKPDEFSRERTIDAREYEIRRIFQKVIESAKAMPAQIVGKKTNFTVTGIHFAHGEASLNESAKEFLRGFALDLEQSADFRTDKLYVVGLASDARTEKGRWILSAERAAVVADFLRSELLGGEGMVGSFGGPPGWSIYSWGAGQGGDWISVDSLATERTQILIAVLRNDD